jgi:hypothetical protein
MKSTIVPPPGLPDSVIIDDWPMNLEATRTELGKAIKRLERYQAVLRLASVEIEQRNRFIVALTTYASQAGRAAKQNDVIKLALVQAVETIGAPIGAILLVHPKTKELTLGVHKGLTPELIDILIGKEINKGATALMPHLAAGDGALLEYETTDDPKENPHPRSRGGPWLFSSDDFCILLMSGDFRTRHISYLCCVTNMIHITMGKNDCFQIGGIFLHFFSNVFNNLFCVMRQQLAEIHFLSHRRTSQRIGIKLFI